ncbi:MAG: OmpA family protein [Spirochaetales bacterium]|nr:OmpA family protein [Spirochaetales bacterium]
MRRKFFFIGLLLITLIFHLNAQSAEELYSPVFLATGTRTTSFESPVGDVINPAASALKQRSVLDLSYIHLSDFGLSSTPWSFGLNAGITLPSKYGVFSSSAHFVNSAFPGTNIGTLFDLSASFSKDLFPNFLVGAGIQGQLGAQGAFDWGLGLDLGVMHILGDLAFLKDFRWGFALRGLGKGYQSTGDNRYLPQAFTPSMGVDFHVIKSDVVKVSFAPEVSFPGLINQFKAGLSTEVSLFDTLFLYGSVNLGLNIAQAAGADTSRPFYSFGMAVKYTLPISKDIQFLDISEKGWDKSEIKTNIIAAPVNDGVWAIGAGLNIPLGVADTNPPVVKMEVADESYISPNLDGVQDDIVLPLDINDERYVKGYRLIITDSQGEVVQTIENKDERPENVDVQNVLDRLLYVKKGITIPESIRWDGKTDKGTQASDGAYEYQLEVWDDNGNKSLSSPKKVYIDSRAPEIESKSAYLVFSPNNDGNKDVLEIDQNGSSEDLWTAVVSDVNGNVVKTQSWSDSAPQKYAWDGTNDEGIMVVDGVYSYSISSTDRAGNTSRSEIANIIINTQATPINVSLGLSDFSPNGDGVKDSLRFNFEIPVTTGIVDWRLEISSQGTVKRTISGKNAAPSYVEFDGKSDSNSILPEGQYQGRLVLLYENGNNPESVTPSFVIDMTAPTADIAADLKVFSPNNDGNKDVVKISQETSEEDLWTGEIRNARNQVVKSMTWRGKADSSFVWDGRNNSGSLIEDGSYNYKLFSTDKAGNAGQSDIVAFQLNTEETPVILSTDLSAFSPNNDGIKDVITISPYLKSSTGVDRYEYTILNASGKAVRANRGTNKEPGNFVWNGKDDAGLVVADGEYKAQLTVLFKNGNNPVSITNPFVIDTQYPTIELDAEYTLFSPDGDGQKDQLIVAQKSSYEPLWEGEIFDSKKQIVKSFFWKGTTANLVWDGKDEKGNKLADGVYSYTVKGEDLAGNPVEKTLPFIKIDNRQTTVFLTVASDGFSPNGDNKRDAIEFQLYVNLQEDIKEWRLEMIHDLAGVQRTFRGDGKVDSKILWDGLNDQDKLSAEGKYTAKLTVEYLKGNSPQGLTTPFNLDVKAPKVDLFLNPLPFSPDNDGVDDELFISLSVDDTSNIAQWSLKINDPTGKLFTEYKGKGQPSENIIWDGWSPQKELVQSAEDYPLELMVEDIYGNRASVKRVIPIDILVIRDGDRLKIRIPSITFKPDTDDYLNVPADRLEKNMATLNRLAEIFKKYASYNILIQGHAVSLFWDDPVKGKNEQEEELLPLSKKRAESIKKGLVELGIASARIQTEGIGGAEPVVPHGDLDNRWKNRRVEFLLVKKN